MGIDRVSDAVEANLHSEVDDRHHYHHHHHPHHDPHHDDNHPHQRDNQTRSGIKSAFRGSLPSFPHHHLPSETTHTLTITTSNTSMMIIMSCPRLTQSNRAKPQWPKHWGRFIFLKIVISDLRSSIDQLISFGHYHYLYYDLLR